jgi:N-acetylneuraminic acid mutarotase
MPTPRQEIYPATLDDRIYFVGGFDSRVRTSAVSEVFDPSSSTWLTIADLPEARHHITLAATENRVFAIGGFIVDVNNWSVRGDVYEFDPFTDTWTSKTPMPIPSGEHVAAYVDGRIYTIGGRDGNLDDTGTCQRYNPETDKWTLRTSMPTPRNSAAVTVINSIIYVIGGRRTVGSTITNLDVVEAYSPVIDTWYTLTDMPEARGGLSAASLNGLIYVFGGETFEAGGGVFRNVLEYDPEINFWRIVSSMPTPRHGTDAVAVGDTIFIIGGADTPGAGAVGTNEGFVIPSTRTRTSDQESAVFHY